jgi:peptide/nickel transport system substrate-binding protein
LERNPNYWGQPAYLDKAYIKITDSDAGIAGLQRGEVDIISDGVPPSDVDDLKNAGSITVTSFPFDTCLTLYPNLKTAFSDVRVRQALMYGIDRESIVKSVLQGYGKVAYSVYAETSPYFSPNVNKYPFDVTKAKQLLADAQWDSTKELAFYVGSGDKVTEQTATVIQQQLQAIGIKANLQLQEFSSFVTRLLKNHDFDLALAGNVGLNNLDVSRRFACRMYTDGVNAGGYCNPALDSIMDQARATVRLEDQKPLTDKIQQTLIDEAATVPMYYRDNIGAVNTSRIGGATPHFGGVHRDIAKWYVKA